MTHVLARLTLSDYSLDKMLQEYQGVVEDITQWKAKIEQLHWNKLKLLWR